MSCSPCVATILFRAALAEPPFGQLLVDRPAVTHGDHLDDATRAVDRVDHPKPPHPELPQALQLSPQGRTLRRIIAEGAKGVPHAALQVGVQAADDVGNVWRDDEPVSPHLPTPLARRSERLAEDLFEGEALTAGREVPPAAPDLPHERRIAQHVEGRLETLVLREVHEHRSGLALAGHHDLFLTLLDAGQQLGEVRLHLGDGQRACYAARLHVDQNSARRVSRPGTPSNPTPILVTGSRLGRATRPSGRTTSPSGSPRERRWSGAAPGGCETG